MSQTRWLYKLMSTYWEIGIFRTLPKIYVRAPFNYFCKTLHLKSLRGFWIYVRVLNIPEFPGLHRVYLFTPIFIFKYGLGYNYGRILNILGFRICQVSAYACITQCSEYAWIWLNNAWINISGYGRVLNMSGQSFTGLWTCLWF